MSPQHIIVPSAESPGGCPVQWPRCSKSLHAGAAVAGPRAGGPGGYSSLGAMVASVAAEECRRSA